jgi:site-specific DNA recombinase
LVTAYQEGLVTLAELRKRMPELRRQAQSVESELQSLEMAAVGEARYLRLAETLTGFRTKLRARAETSDVRQRQQILRLIVKEVLVGSDTITLRHSIPSPQSGPGLKVRQRRLSLLREQRLTQVILCRTRSHFCTTRQASAT